MRCCEYGPRVLHEYYFCLKKAKDNHSSLACLAVSDEEKSFKIISARLAKTWQGLQEEMVVLSHLNSLLKSLYGHTR